MGVEAIPLRLAVVWRTGSLRCERLESSEIASATCGYMKAHSCVASARRGISTRCALSRLFGVKLPREPTGRSADDDSGNAANQGIRGGGGPPSNPPSSRSSRDSNRSHHPRRLTHGGGETVPPTSCLRAPDGLFSIDVSGGTGSTRCAAPSVANTNRQMHSAGVCARRLPWFQCLSIAVWRRMVHRPR